MNQLNHNHNENKEINTIMELRQFIFIQKQKQNMFRQFYEQNIFLHHRMSIKINSFVIFYSRVWKQQRKQQQPNTPVVQQLYIMQIVNVMKSTI